jgi:pimeloyl-ACP methyl ester carboxylesterase
MNLISYLLLVICSLMMCAHAAIETKEYPLTRNHMKLNLMLYEDPAAVQVTMHPDVLLVHGLTYSSHQFDINVKNYSLARILAKQGFRVWLLDITGYGQSQKPKNGFMINSDYAAQDINAAADFIMDEKESTKINVIGWSWGTITTSRFAAAYPGKVSKLVLVAPILHGQGLPAPHNDYESFNAKMAKQDIDNAAIEPVVAKTYVTQLEKYDGKGSPNGGRKDLFQSTKTQLIPYQQLKVPVFLIAGDRDKYLSAKKDFATILKGAPKGSCGDIIKGAGHALFLEKPYYQQFQHDVSLFLLSGCEKAWMM